MPLLMLLQCANPQSSQFCLSGCLSSLLLDSFDPMAVTQPAITVSVLLHLQQDSNVFKNETLCQSVIVADGVRDYL